MHVIFHRLSLCGVLLALGLLVYGAEAKPTNIPPLMVEVLQFNKTPMVPLRPLLDISGAAITVKGTAYTVTRGQHTFAFTLQSTAAQQDAQAVTLPLAPFLTGGVAYVPLEPLATAFGGSIALHEPEKTVEITLPECAPFTFMLDTPKAPLAKYKNDSLELYVMNSDGSGLRRLSYTGDDDNLPVFAPDGTKCVFGYKNDLYHWSIDEPYPQYFMPMRHPWYEYYGSPVFSADGQKIACAVFTEDQFCNLYVMNADGTDKRIYESLLQPCFSPDGKTIAGVDVDYEGDREKDYVYIMNTDGTGRRQICEGNNPHFSPDGSVLVTSKQVDARLDGRALLMHHLSGPNAGKTFAPQPKADGTYSFERFSGFSPDGKEIYFTHGYTPVEAILEWSNDYAVTLDRSATRELDPMIFSRSVPHYTPDGSRLFYNDDRGLNVVDLKTKQEVTLAQKLNVMGFGLTPDEKLIFLLAYSK